MVMLDDAKKRMLERKALEMRKSILTMLVKAGSGHTGGSLSVIDILVVLYYHKMRFDACKPGWEGRDRLILSKGHACPALYAILADLNVFPKSELDKLRRIDGILQGHPDMLKTPGIEVSTGSLGQGLSIGNGMALAGKLDNKDYKVYVILGDGECQEGQIWEAAMTAAHRGLDNLCAILDYNGLQIDGWVREVKNIEPIADKWLAFGWEVFYIDGHDYYAIAEVLDAVDKIKGKPSIVIAKTIKGKGVSIMENEAKYHGVAPTKEEYEKAMQELNYGNY